jgi:ubiquinone/menaquinone biosynthesis C-methylase UbiE
MLSRNQKKIYLSRSEQLLGSILTFFLITFEAASFSIYLIAGRNGKGWTHHSYLYSILYSSSSSEQEKTSRFGRQDYWDSFYQNAGTANASLTFSWYTGWKDLAPFIREMISTNDRILIPGVGNDALLVDMYLAGCQRLTAFDFAPESIARYQEMLQKQDIPFDVKNHDETSSPASGVTLFVGDATNLQTEMRDDSFDAVLEKGTLDAIIQSGPRTQQSLESSSSSSSNSSNNMELALAELTRVIQPGGLFISVSAICTEALQSSPRWMADGYWQVVCDGTLYFTEDGYASNNFDGTLLVWQKREKESQQ